MNSKATFSFCGIVIATICVVVFTTACGQKKEYKGPDGYDMENPQKLTMINELDEISGISYYAKDQGIFAESDEMGYIYKFALAQPHNVKRWKFGHKQDFEDMVLLDSVFYLLSSNGDILSLKFNTQDSFAKTEYRFPEKKCEFESLYYDDAKQKLVLICKNCTADNSKTLRAYSFDMTTGTYEPAFIIDVTPILQLVKEDAKRFKPSAAALHPITKELYIVSSINKLLVVADRDGHIKKAYQLDPSYYKQPEGLCFTPTGDMLISNESAGQGLADILVYSYNKAQKK